MLCFACACVMSDTNEVKNGSSVILSFGNIKNTCMFKEASFSFILVPYKLYCFIACIIEFLYQTGC